MVHKSAVHKSLKAPSESDRAIPKDLKSVHELNSTDPLPAPFDTETATLKHRLTNLVLPKRSQTLDVRKHAVNPVLFVRRWAQIRLPNDTPTAQIPKELKAARHRSHLRKYFIPEPEIKRIVSRKAVEQNLSKSNYSRLGRMGKEPISIKDDAPYVKILTVLYLMKQPTKIRLFVKSGVCDRDLPLDRIQRPDGSYALRSRYNSQACVVSFKRRDYTEDFLDHQWSVLAPTFMRTDDVVPHVHLEPEVILPFLSCIEVSKQGGSSRVFKTVIQSDHDLLDKTKV